MKKDIVFLSGARTPMAEYSGTPGGGKLKDMTAVQLGAAAGSEALKRSKIDPDLIGHVVMGNANQAGNDALYGARDVALRINELPLETPALTLNRICGSGAQAIVTGAHHLMVGEAEAVISGGFESMSQTPYAIRGIRGNAPKFGPGVMLEDILFASLQHPYINMFMAQTAEKLARMYGITREQCDQFAYESQTKASEAIKAGKFDAEKIAIEVPAGRGKTAEVWEDDHNRADTKLESLAKLRPAFGRNGLVTAGNASGIVDGAAAVVITTCEVAEREGLNVWARLIDWHVAAVDPTIMGYGPVPAVQKLLEKTGLTVDDIDVMELNEAFAPQALPVIQELGIDPAKVNPNGGAIALGHPLGATGCILTNKLIYDLHSRGGGKGISTMCIGGGQGIALLVEV